MGTVIQKMQQDEQILIVRTACCNEISGNRHSVGRREVGCTYIVLRVDMDDRYKLDQEVSGTTMKQGTHTVSMTLFHDFRYYNHAAVGKDSVH
jgi:hypothetical protein